MVRPGETKTLKDLEIGATIDELRLRLVYNSMYILVALNELDAAQLASEISEWIKSRETQVAQTVSEEKPS